MTTQALMTLNQLANELHVPYSQLWQCARNLGLVEFQSTGAQLIVIIDDEKMGTYCKAADMGKRYAIAFPKALRIVLDGWDEPEVPQSEHYDNPGI